MSEIKTKVCSKCKEELEATKENFCVSKSGKYGLDAVCKSCHSIKNKIRNEKIKNEVKITPETNTCIKCNRTFPCNVIYFPPDKTCKKGFRNVCRECGNDGHFMEEGYIPRRNWWTKEEEQLLIDNYSKYTNSELIKLFFHNETNKSLQDKAWTLGATGKTPEVIDRMNEEKSEKMSGENSLLFGKPMPEKTKLKVKNSLKKYYITHVSYWLGKKRSEKQKQQLSVRMKGKWAGDKNPKYNNPQIGKDNPNWKGGRTPLYFELRTQIKEWQQKSRENCNYKCVITNGKFDNIHHLHPFKNIVDECFEILQLDIRQKVEDYSDEEFKNIVKILSELHIKYGYGVCLKKEIHKLFHDNFGYFNNTPEQFEEFKLQLKNNKFNDYLEDNNLKLAI